MDRRAAGCRSLTVAVIVAVLLEAAAPLRQRWMVTLEQEAKPIRTHHKAAAQTPVQSHRGRLPPMRARSRLEQSQTLIKGAVDVAKNAAIGRINDTVGAKVAAAIEARGETSSKGANESNSLSAGSGKSADLQAEVAAFRDRGV